MKYQFVKGLQCYECGSNHSLVEAFPEEQLNQLFPDVTILCMDCYTDSLNQDDE